MERIELGNDLTVPVPGYAGVEVTLRRGTGVRDYLLFRQLGALEGLTDESVDAFEDGIRKFGDSMIVEWNIDVRGEPLEANGTGLLKLPASFQLGLLQVWMTNLKVGIDAPLDYGSANGSTLEEEPVATAAE